MALRFLHCSDIHLLSLRGVGPHRFMNKRLTGGINLMLRRGKHHSGALFDRMMARASELAVDRVVITGDLSNLALEQEFEHIAAKLEGVGLPVTVIPGNHDAYTRGSARSRRFEAMLGQFMFGEWAGEPAGERPGHADSLYPFVQREGGVALVGVSTAHASLPMYAVGTVGEAQLRRLDGVLARLAEEGLARVILIHHPVLPGVAKARHDLLDLAAFGELIARRGAELILHGHEHVMIEGSLPGPAGPVPVHGISSGTNLSRHPGREAAFAIYSWSAGSFRREIHRWDGADFRLDAS